MFNCIMSIGFIISLIMVFIATSSYLDKVSKGEMDEEDSHIFKFALTMFFLVMLANALWFGLLQEGIWYTYATIEPKKLIPMALR